MTNKIDCIIWDSANKNFKFLFRKRLFDLIPTAFSDKNHKHTFLLGGVHFFLTVGDTPEDPDMTASALISGHLYSTTSICIYKPKIVQICIKQLMSNYYYRNLKHAMNTLLDHN